MLYCDLTLPTPETNLACDEVLLDACETGDSGPLLRFWEPAQHFVVVGYANRVDAEINLTFCREESLPILRRCTGGGAVLQGPGCLNYSLVLPCEKSGPLAGIAGTNRHVLERHRSVLAAALARPVQWLGQTDLAIGGLKFSGNSQRRRSKFLLFHGSFLLSFDLQLIEKALLMPSRQPDYRQNRPHSQFLLNLNVPAQLIKTALIQAWDAIQPLAELPSERINSLVREKYSQAGWNFKF